VSDERLEDALLFTGGEPLASVPDLEHERILAREVHRELHRVAVGRGLDRVGQ
jgi:hypothetical protein